MNATDTEEYIREGFAALIKRLDDGADSDPNKSARSNADALQREQARVRAEYLHLGLEPPSPLALSITARRELGIGLAEPDAGMDDGWQDEAVGQ